MPTSQQNKPEIQETSTDFLIDYLAKNKFNMGGQMKQNRYANGGEIMQKTPQDQGGMTQIPNSAGTHEQNPNGGVQVGVGQNGQPNTVEGGETMRNGYVYSDTLTLDETILKKVGLPKNFKGKTIAEVSKQMEKTKEEQPNDKITKDTADENLDKLKKANEILRLTEELLAPDAPQGGEGGQEEHQMPDGSMMPGESHGDPGLGDMMGQAPPQEQFFLGGSPVGAYNNKYPQQQFMFGGDAASSATDAATSGGGPGIGGYAQAAMGALGAAQTAFGDTGVDTSGRSEYIREDVSLGGAAASGAASGAMAGMAFGPWGAAIGGVIGGGAGLIGGARKQNDLAEARGNSDARMMNTAKYGGQFAFGGYMDPPKNNPQNTQGYQQSSNKFKNGGYKNQFPNGGFGQGFGQSSFSQQLDDSLFDPLNSGNEIAGLDLVAQDRVNPLKNSEDSTAARPLLSTRDLQENVNFLKSQDITTQGPSLDSLTSAVTPVLAQTPPESESGGFWNSLGSGVAAAARYTPAAMNAFQLSQMNGPDTERLDRLGNRYNPNYVDERTMQNIAQSNYNTAASGIKGATGGSQGALRANLLGAHLQRTKGISDAYIKAGQMNAAEDSKAQQFNLGVNRTNLQQSNQEKDWNARNKGAYESNKSKLMSQIGTDIGNIGLEETRKKYPERLGLLYDYLGKYMG